MQTFINLISLLFFFFFVFFFCFFFLFFLDKHLFSLIIQIRKSKDLCMSKIPLFQKSENEMCLPRPWVCFMFKYAYDR